MSFKSQNFILAIQLGQQTFQLQNCFAFVRFLSKSSQFERKKAKQQWRHRMRTLISNTECAGDKTIGNGISNAVNICGMKWKSSLLMRTAKTEKKRQQNNGLERAQNLRNYESHDTSKNLNCKRIMLYDVDCMACFWP